MITPLEIVEKIESSWVGLDRCEVAGKATHQIDALLNQKQSNMDEFFLRYITDEERREGKLVECWRIWDTKVKEQLLPDALQWMSDIHSHIPMTASDLYVFYFAVVDDCNQLPLETLFEKVCKGHQYNDAHEYEPSNFTLGHLMITNILKHRFVSRMQNQAVFSDNYRPVVVKDN